MVQYNKQDLISLSTKIISTYQEIILNEILTKTERKVFESNMEFINELVKISIFIDKEPLDVKESFFELFNNVISDNITTISLVSTD